MQSLPGIIVLAIMGLYQYSQGAKARTMGPHDVPPLSELSPVRKAAGTYALIALGAVVACLVIATTVATNAQPGNDTNSSLNTVVIFAVLAVVAELVAVVFWNIWLNVRREARVRAKVPAQTWAVAACWAPDPWQVANLRWWDGTQSTTRP